MEEGEQISLVPFSSFPPLRPKLPPPMHIDPIEASWTSNAENITPASLASQLWLL